MDVTLNLWRNLCAETTFHTGQITVPICDGHVVLEPEHCPNGIIKFLIVKVAPIGVFIPLCHNFRRQNDSLECGR